MGVHTIPPTTLVMKLFVVLSLAAAAAALPTEDCPGCVPYVHEEIAAEPYIHEEIPAEEYVHVSGIQAARARGAVAAPQQQAAPVQQFAPQQAAPQRFAPQQQQLYLSSSNLFLSNSNLLLSSSLLLSPLGSTELAA